MRKKLEEKERALAEKDEELERCKELIEAKQKLIIHQEDQLKEQDQMLDDKKPNEKGQGDADTMDYEVCSRLLDIILVNIFRHISLYISLIMYCQLSIIRQHRHQINIGG